MSSAFLALAGFTVLVFGVIAVVFYVLKSMGLYTLAFNRGIENPWLAWIPVADLYIMGLLVEEVDIFNYHLDNMGLWCPVIVVGGSILANIPVIGVLVWVALFIFAVFFVYKLFEIYTQQAVLYTVLSVPLGLLAIFLFVIRNNKPIASDGTSTQPPASDF